MGGFSTKIKTAPPPQPPIEYTLEALLLRPNPL